MQIKKPDNIALHTRVKHQPRTSKPALHYSCKLPKSGFIVNLSSEQSASLLTIGHKEEPLAQIVIQESTDIVMGMIILIEEGDEQRCAIFAERGLPLNYMEDFSLLAFAVDRFEEACNVLRAAGYTVEKQKHSALVTYRNYRSLPNIQKSLADSRINAQYRDIAETFYQG